MDSGDGKLTLCAFPLACRQVFGLAGMQRKSAVFLISAASRPNAGPVLISRISFLLTAAGQFRIHTGFPFRRLLYAKRRTDSFRKYSGAVWETQSFGGSTELWRG